MNLAIALARPGHTPARRGRLGCDGFGYDASGMVFEPGHTIAFHRTERLAGVETTVVVFRIAWAGIQLSPDGAPEVLVLRTRDLHLTDNTLPTSNSCRHPEPRAAQVARVSK